ncbi:MAG: HpcH/HpaI aldolase family protein [bacterium]
MIGNRAVERLRAGEVAIGTTVRIPCAVTVDILRRHPFDYLILDMEHGAFGLDALREMLLPLDAAKTAPIVRVPENSAALIGQVLDLGAAGIVVPGVESADDAARAVRAARYPPAGTRGVCFGLSPQGYGSRELETYVAHANRTILVGLMIETPAGVEQIEQIVQVSGIDVIYVGRFDLAYSMGLELPAQKDDSRYTGAIGRVEGAVLRSRIHLGGGASDAGQAAERVRAGVRFLHMHSDQALFSRSAAELAETLVAARKQAR